MKQTSKPWIESQLHQLQLAFYKDDQRRFYRDKHMLIYAITWTAGWLRQRSIAMSQQQYQQCFTTIIQEIQRHADPQKTKAYFPRYLLKSIQNYLHHNEDKIYFQLKHISSIADIAMNIIQQHNNTADFINTLANVNQILAPKYANRKKTDHSKQMMLF